MSKIAYLSKSTLPSRTANSVHVMKMCQALANEGNKVTLYSYKGEQNDDIFDFYGVKKIFSVVRTRRIFNNFIQPLIHYIKVKWSFHRDNSHDTIYSRDLLTIYFFRNKEIPIAYEAHSYPMSKINIKLENALFKSKSFKFLGVISKALEEKYMEMYPDLLKGKIIVLPDGADLPLEIDDLNDQENLSTQLFDQNRNQIGYIGHLYKGRGIDIVIEISKRLKDCDFHIIGGEQKDIEYWSNLAGKQKNIFFHGFVPNSKLFYYYNQLDILLAPYQAEVMIGNGKTDTSKWMSPMKIFEYMSYKKCIISSDLDVLREVLVDRYNSILVHPTSVDAWVSGITEVINDKNLYKELSNNAYNDLVNKYTWAGRAKKIVDRFAIE